MRITAEDLLKEIDSTFADNHTMQQDNLVLLAHDQVYATSDDSMQLRILLQQLKKADNYELSLITNYPKQKISGQ